MALSDYKILGSEINTNGVVSAPDILTGTTQENKAIFDKLPTLIINKFNALIDSISATGAEEIGIQPFDEITANNIQDALKQIRDLIGTYYSGADGAGKVGYTPSEDVDEDTVQAAIEAVQANLTAYIAKIKAATGAAEVGNAPIAGMTATNVQQALEELRENIDNIVSGIIPGGSITSDMLQDGAVTADKLGSDVAAKLGVLGGATTPQAALANLGAGVRPNLLDNAIFIGGGTADNLPVNQKSQTSYSGAAGFCIDRWYRFVDANISLLSNGIVFNAGSKNNLIEQKIAKNLTGYKVTMSAIVDDNLYAGTKIVDTLDYTNTVEIPEGSLQVFYDGSNTVFRLWFDSTSQHTVKAVKLELVENQTLAYQYSDGAWHLLPQPESDYATQLLKCQRYYQIYSTADARPSKAVDCRPVMRTDPAQGTIVVGDTTYYYNTAEL